MPHASMPHDEGLKLKPKLKPESQKREPNSVGCLCGQLLPLFCFLVFFFFFCQIPLDPYNTFLFVVCHLFAFNFDFNI